MEINPRMTFGAYKGLLGFGAGGADVVQLPFAVEMEEGIARIHHQAKAVSNQYCGIQPEQGVGKDQGRPCDTNQPKANRKA